MREGRSACEMDGNGCVNHSRVLHFGASLQYATVDAVPTELSLEGACDIVNPLPGTDLRMHCQRLAHGWDHVLTVHKDALYGR